MPIDFEKELAAINFDQELAAMQTPPETPAPEPQRSPMEFLGEMVGNIPGSAKRAAVGMWESLPALAQAAQELTPGGMTRRMVNDEPSVLAQIISGIPSHYAGRYGSAEAREKTVREDPVGMVLDMLPAAKAPHALSLARQGAGAAKRGVIRTAANHPTATSVLVGATPGVATGNPLVALGGAAYGFERAPAISRYLNRMLKDVEAKAPKPAAATSPASALQQQIMLREGPIDWRTTDAVPIDAITRDITRGGSIIEAGESRIGLADRAAAASKAKDAAEVERLLRALRQRKNINGL